MAAEREPPPLGDGKPTDFEELEDGEDLFTSTVSTLEVRPRRRGCFAPLLPRVSPFGACPASTLRVTPQPPGLQGPGWGDTCDAGPTSRTCHWAGVGLGGQACLGEGTAGPGADLIP